MTEMKKSVLWTVLAILVSTNAASSSKYFKQVWLAILQSYNLNNFFKTEMFLSICETF